MKISCFALVALMSFLASIAPATQSSYQKYGFAVAQKSAVDSDQLAQAKQLGLEGKKLFQEGKFKEALLPVKKSLEIKEKILGRDHRSVATSLFSLGTIYQAIGDLEAAEQQYLRALKICEKTASQPEDLKEISILSVLDGLADCYEKKADWGKAEAFHQRALSWREMKLGPQHTDVGSNLLNLAIVQIEKKSYDKAELNLKQALSILEKSIGATHLKYAEVLDSYAWLLRRIQREDEADKTIDQVNQIVFDNATDKNAPLEILWRSFPCRILKKKTGPPPLQPSGIRLSKMLTMLRMKVWVDEDGIVTQVQTLSRRTEGINELEEDVKKIIFKPARVRGKPMKMVGLIVHPLQQSFYLSIR